MYVEVAVVVGCWILLVLRELQYILYANDFVFFHVATLAGNDAVDFSLEPFVDDKRHPFHRLEKARLALLKGGLDSLSACGLESDVLRVDGMHLAVS